jgi:small-conductance mechanosensitive channel
MNVLPLLAQETAAKRLLERWFETQPAVLSIPVYVAAVTALAWIVERVAVAVMRHMSRRTVTKVDDALADGLPWLLRPIFALAALHVVVRQLLRSAEDPSQLSDEGKLANQALTVIAILVMAFAAVHVISRMIDAWVAADAARLPVGPPLKLGLKVAMVPIALLAALEGLNYPVTSLITALGIGSLAVGLALQDTLKNMFAGIQLVLDRPIRAGDFVDVDKTARGTVLEIGLRSTKLRSVDNNVIVVPNATIAGAVVTNFDVQDRSYLQTFDVAVAYGVDTRRVQALLEEVAAAAQKDMPALVPEPPRATLRQLGESSVDFSVDLKFRQFTGRLPLVTEIYHRFYERLRAEGIEVPYPTRTVYLRRDDAPPTAEASTAPSR